MKNDVRLKITVRLMTEDNEKWFGPGVATLLEQVRACSSLRAAAASMGMAYSKAWKIVRAAEAALGCKLLQTSIGGRSGGGAVLTAEAEELVEKYRRCCAQLEADADEVFRREFGGTDASQ